MRYLALYVICISILFSKMAIAENLIDTTCTSSSALHLPHRSEKQEEQGVKYRYEMRIVKNVDLNYQSVGNASHFFKFSILKSDQLILLTEFTANLSTQGNGIPKQILRLPMDRFEELNVVFLNPDFSQNFLATSYMPHAVIFPQNYHTLHRMKLQADALEKEKKILFHTKEKFFPYFGIPGTWLFENCL